MLLWDVYQEQAARTIRTDQPLDLQLAVLALGLGGEVGEVSYAVKHDVASLSNEIGDVLWYISAICKFLQIPLSQLSGSKSFDDLGVLAYDWIYTSDFLEDEFIRPTLMISDHIKKIVGHGHALNAPLLERKLQDITAAIATLCEVHGLDLEQVALANIAKLITRYPQGFSEESSRNRV